MALRNTAREIARGMAYLHAMDILHGDLTAGNILLRSSDSKRRAFSAKVSSGAVARDSDRAGCAEMGC